jgi:hypothetical protein
VKDLDSTARIFDYEKISLWKTYTSSVFVFNHLSQILMSVLTLFETNDFFSLGRFVLAV